jgi:hypothetical protein
MIVEGFLGHRIWSKNDPKANQSEPSPSAPFIHGLYVQVWLQNVVDGDGSIFRRLEGWKWGVVGCPGANTKMALRLMSAAIGWFVYYWST